MTVFLLAVLSISLSKILTTEEIAQLGRASTVYIKENFVEKNLIFSYDERERIASGVIIEKADSKYIMPYISKYEIAITMLDKKTCFSGKMFLNEDFKVC